MKVGDALRPIPNATTTTEPQLRKTRNPAPVTAREANDTLIGGKRRNIRLPTARPVREVGDNTSQADGCLCDRVLAQLARAENQGHNGP